MIIITFVLFSLICSHCCLVHIFCLFFCCLKSCSNKAKQLPFGINNVFGILNHDCSYSLIHIIPTKSGFSTKLHYLKLPVTSELHYTAVLLTFKGF